MSKMTNVKRSLADGGLTEALTKYSDIMLAGLVIGIVGMMLIPLPTFLLDILLTMNITLAVTILLVTLYVPGAIKFASFPTVLLIATLFRLALNVSSTRLILLYAYAGEVIKSFGNFVVKGNFVVGAVIFLILTLIQFIVISKGSERVAEVAARFTLDALPGKQMSIDADMRAGSISMEEGKRRREELERESQLYGSMDGAMKFVKGDAIAGIIITAINIIGGLIIGIMQQGMSAGEAAQTYTLLTIGDGLVSQIPALLLSTAAGMVVTRVASEHEDSHLGKDIGTQLLDQPKAIGIASGMLFLLGIVPGLPMVPFFILGAVTGTIAYGLLKTREISEEAAEEIEAEEEEKKKEEAAKEGLVSLVTPLALEVGEELTKFVDLKYDGGKFINEMLPMIREGIYQQLGTRLPGVRVRGYSRALGPDMYMILVNEIPVVTGRILMNKILVNEAAQSLKIFNIDAIPTTNPATGSPAAWAPEEKREIIEKAGYKIWDVPGVLTLHLSGVMLKHAHEFIGIQEVQSMLDQMEQAFPALVKAASKAVNTLKLSEALQRLVHEQISIRDFRRILQSVAKWGPIEPDDVMMLTEYIRTDLKEIISYKYSGGKNTLIVHLLDSDIEDLIRSSIKKTKAGNYPNLNPDVAEEILAVMGRELKHSLNSPTPPVILCSFDVRPYFKSIVKDTYPRVAVLSFHEIAGDMNIQPVGQISIG